LSDSPYDTAPDYIPYIRVAAAIKTSNDSGFINLKDGNNKTRLSIEADYSGKPYLFLRDSGQVAKTWFTENEGYINNKKILTEGEAVVAVFG
jgi:hypothetical protein